MKKGKYLITGCAGFIGSNLIEYLSKNSYLLSIDNALKFVVNKFQPSLWDNVFAILYIFFKTLF